MATWGQKLKIHKKNAKNVSATHCSCSMQKTARKNRYYRKNESILKIAKKRPPSKGIDFAKSSLWVKN